MNSVLLILSCFVSYSMALECGIAKANRDNIQQELKMCVKNNETLERLWEMTSGSSSSTVTPSEEKDSESDSEEEVTRSTTRSPRSGKNGKLARIKRAKSFSRNKGSVPNPAEKQVKENRKSDELDNEKDHSKESQNDNEGNELSKETPKMSQGTSEECIIHCVLEQLSLMDDTGLPDRTKFSEELLKNARGRELRNFLQETTDECFQEMNEENDLDSCSYSTKLITCLAERGKANCADWPAGGLPF